MNNEYTKIMLGQIELDEVKNIVRELKSLWQNLDNVWPQGDRKRLPDIRITRDRHGQYWAHMNPCALTYLLLFCKNIPRVSLSKQATDLPMPADFLQIGHPKPE